jgi:hypothetical protein
MSATTRLPYVNNSNSYANAEVGGTVKRFKAGGTLLIGDAVYLSAEDTVNKATGVAGGNRRVSVGVVVGGQSYQKAGGSDRVAVASTETGATAATSNQWVLVQISGIAWAVADAAVTVNTMVALGATTAGRLDDVTFAAGDMLGIALDTATSGGDKIKVLICKV